MTFGSVDMGRSRAAVRCLPLLCPLAGCNPPIDTGEVPIVHPTLAVRDDQKEEILARIGEEPWATMYAEVVAKAQREYVPDAEGIWDHGVNGRNGETAEAAAFLAWLEEDEAMAEKAVLCLDGLETDYENNTVLDVNIRMPEPLMCHANAIDLLLGTPWYGEAEAEAHSAKIVEITDKFYAEFVENDLMRDTWLGFAQNNHPIRTASAIGYVALANPDAPEAEEWADFAVSELDYLWGPDGKYVQSDGGVSEGPFYYGFALAPTVAFSVMLENAIDPDRVFHRTCINRQDVEPWAGHGCVEGEAFTFDNPLHSALFRSTVDWWIAIRQPSGNCPNLEDAELNALTGGAVLSSFGSGGHVTWNWEDNVSRPLESDWGMSLQVQHLGFVAPDVAPVEPPWTTRFLPVAGNAVFRSDWSHDARWLLLIAENGPVRMTLHDHVDSTSFALAAYGEYLLLDPGYYKPNEMNNARTSSPQAHNVVLIEGKGAPAKGLLTDFGDTDAFLENTVDGAVVEYAEARQVYEQTEIVRGVAFLRGRYFVVGDRLSTEAAEPREHAWRLSGYAGFDAGGTFAMRADGATWERTAAGVDVHLASTAPGLAVVAPPYEEFQAPYVHEVDRTVGHHGVIDGIVTALEPGFLGILAPYRVGATGPDAPLAVAAEGGADGIAAWRVTSSEGTDLAVLRDEGAPTSFALGDGTTVSTDARFAVVSLDSDDFALLVRGSYLDVQGVSRATSSGEAVVVVEN